MVAVRRSHPHPVQYSFREYLAHEAASNVKHEYLDGQIYAMAGGTPRHSALISAVNAQLATQVRGGRCRVHMADLRIRVGATGLATYPDVAVICGPWARDAEDENTLVNPSVIVEVLSPSTEEYDRGEKFEHYKRIPSLVAYVLVSHERPEVEVWSKSDRGEWSLAVFGPSMVAPLDRIGCRLDVSEIYADATEPESS
ncbi:MAG: Uma2 family endonuclease [Deltaproteobacteria bacterium]|nr:Uma2 family endonuclease [Deltaproteobacteria bacterium]